jgi:hypothetical protein
MPPFLTMNEAHFIERLLDKNPEKRLGVGQEGSEIVKKQPYFTVSSFPKSVNDMLYIHVSLLNCGFSCNMLRKPTRVGTSAQFLISDTLSRRFDSLKTSVS